MDFVLILVFFNSKSLQSYLSVYISYSHYQLQLCHVVRSQESCQVPHFELSNAAKKLLTYKTCLIIYFTSFIKRMFHCRPSYRNRIGRCIEGTGAQFIKAGVIAWFNLAPKKFFCVCQFRRFSYYKISLCFGAL